MAAVIGKRALNKLGKAGAARTQSMLDQNVVQGEKQLIRKIRKLERGAAKKIMAPATRKSLQVYGKHMRRAIPSRYKNARRGID